MSHKDGRVVLSAWVEPVLRDYAREAAKAAGVQFSQWVEGAVRAERDLLKNHYSPEAAAKLRAELASARAELAFLRKEYGEAESSTLTRDALELKAQVLESSLLHVCKAASEITSWDFSHLLLEHPDAKTLLGDVAALEAALKQHGPERS